jgi:hypothetical protein
MNFVGDALASATCQMHSDQIAPKTCWKRTTAVSVSIGLRLSICRASQSSPFGVRSLCVLK